MFYNTYHHTPLYLLPQQLMNYEHFAHPNQHKNIFLVDMTKELDHYFSELTNAAITKYLTQGKKI
ncbi:MAG: hypothetical protein LBG59_02500 [Candidatus Peribacteria bacterium]|nr:hypothetical protein [Candidatus Peribacteria bacterium]